MSQSINDQAAIEFSVGFYDALGNGDSVESSFEAGKLAMALCGTGDENIPVLLIKNPTEDSDPDISGSGTGQKDERLKKVNGPETLEDRYENRSLLDIRLDQQKHKTFHVVHRGNKKCVLKPGLPTLSAYMTQRVINPHTHTDAHAQAWKRVHTLSEQLHPDYLKLLHYMHLSRNAGELKSIHHASQYQNTAINFMIEMLENQSIKKFEKGLKKLHTKNSSVYRSAPVIVLHNIPKCSNALREVLINRVPFIITK